MMKKSRKIGRSSVHPNNTTKKKKSCMKYATLDESLHAIRTTPPQPEEEEGKDDHCCCRLTRRALVVTFKNVEIREYARTVGDNPCCSSGPPVSISWEYLEAVVFSVDAFEMAHPPRRSMMEMVLPRSVRTNMLKSEWHIPQSEIAAAVRSNIRIKNQRRSTVNNLGKVNGINKVDEVMEGVGRRVSRLWRSSVRSQVQKLDHQRKLAEAQRKQILLEQSMKEEYNVMKEENDVVDDCTITEDASSLSIKV